MLDFKFKCVGGKYFFLEKLSYFRGSCFSLCFKGLQMYYQQLSIVCYQVSFYAYKYFE